MGRRARANSLSLAAIRFSILNVPHIVKRAHRNYTKDLNELEPVFVNLSKNTLPYGAIQVFHNQTGIPDSTLKTWRSDLLEYPSWRPQANSPKKMAITPEGEAAIHEKAFLLTT